MVQERVRGSWQGRPVLEAWEKVGGTWQQRNPPDTWDQVRAHDTTAYWLCIAMRNDRKPITFNRFNPSVAQLLAVRFGRVFADSTLDSSSPYTVATSHLPFWLAFDRKISSLDIGGYDSTTSRSIGTPSLVGYLLPTGGVRSLDFSVSGVGTTNTISWTNP